MVKLRLYAHIFKASSRGESPERERDTQSKSVMWIVNPHVQMKSSIQIFKLTMKKTKVATHMCTTQKVLQMNSSFKKVKGAKNEV